MQPGAERRWIPAILLIGTSAGGVLAVIGCLASQGWQAAFVECVALLIALRLLTGYLIRLSIERARRNVAAETSPLYANTSRGIGVDPPRPINNSKERGAPATERVPAKRPSR